MVSLPNTEGGRGKSEVVPCRGPTYWLQTHVGRVSAVSDLGKAIRYALRHWPGLVVFLDDGRIEMDTNTVERAIRHYLNAKMHCCGSDGGACIGQRDDTDTDSETEWHRSHGYLTDVLERIVWVKPKPTLAHVAAWNWTRTPPARSSTKQLMRIA